MKKVFRISFLLLLFSTEVVAASNFNPFKERKIVIGEFINHGENKYDYLGESLRNIIYNYALTVSVITLTDDEIEGLKILSKIEKYKKLFSEAGEKISYRLKPLIEKGMAVTGDYPIYIQGSYDVINEDNVLIEIMASNALIEKVIVSYQIKVNLLNIVDEPWAWLIPFFRDFLRYKAYTFTVQSVPYDSLIFLDGKLIGVGVARNILVAPGLHRVSVKKKGYYGYSDIIKINKDGYFKTIELREEEKNRELYICTVPANSRIYVDEKLSGESPLTIYLSGGIHTLTFKKDGYLEKTLRYNTVPDERERLNVSLIEINKEQSAYSLSESHKRISKALYYTGMGFLGLSIIFGAESTLNAQRADLYKESNEDIYRSSLKNKALFSYLTIASSMVMGGVFTFSFVELLKYFKYYRYPAKAFRKNNNITILEREVRF